VLADEPAPVGETEETLGRYARAAAAGTDDFDRYAASEIAWRLRHLRSVAALRPHPSPVRPAGWTHGDINRLNLLFDGAGHEPGRVCGVLDWDRLGVRPYGLEVVRTAVLLFDTGAGPDLPRVAAFAGGYRARHPIGDEALRDAAHRRWWQLTCDAWFLRLHYDRGSTACDHLLRTQGLFLRWWTAHRDRFDRALLA
jgi:homoserine kinase type II